jgi:hypothetical protein
VTPDFHQCNPRSAGALPFEIRNSWQRNLLENFPVGLGQGVLQLFYAGISQIPIAGNIEK